MSRRIAIIEDQPELAENYRAALEREHFAVDVYRDRSSALAAFARGLPDLAIIDIELGDEPRGGHDVCRWLREQSKTLPILFLTARDGEMDELIGLELGANDYLTKNVSLPVLLTRVRNLFKWLDAMLTTADNGAEVIEQGPLSLDLDRLQARWKDTPVRLTHSEFLVLECLARHPGHVKTYQQLMDAADKTIAQESVGSYIKRIRAAFRAADPGCRPIRSEYGVGYSWQGEAGA